MLRLAGQAVVGERVAGEIHPAAHGEAAAHDDQDSQDGQYFVTDNDEGGAINSSFKIKGRMIRLLLLIFI